MEKKQKLYTSQQVAQELGISYSHVRTLIRTGLAKPDQRIGNNWVFTMTEIERVRNRPIGKGGRPKKKVETEP